MASGGEKNKIRCLLLITPTPLTLEQRGHITEVQRILASQEVIYEDFDATNPDNRELRNKMFEVSGRRGQFPLLFILRGEDGLEFVGGYEEIFSANECEADSGDLTKLLQGCPANHQAKKETVVVRA